MNSLFDILNYIKTKSNQNWLSNSQKMALKKIINYLEIHRSVNLFGPIGSGKTFLMWVFSKMYPDWKYLPIPPRESEFQDFSGVNLILDNFSSDPKEYRRALYLATLYNIKKLIFVTNSEIDDAIPKVELCLKEYDIKKILNNLCVIGIDNNVVKKTTVKEDTSTKYSLPTNLWKLINPILVEKY